MMAFLLSLRSYDPLNTMHDLGTIYLANGDKYHGDWKDGRRHGIGTYFYRQVA